VFFLFEAGFEAADESSVEVDARVFVAEVLRAFGEF